MGSNDRYSLNKNPSLGVLSKILLAVTFCSIIYLEIETPQLISMAADSFSPTRGQLERTLSQRIQALYRTQLEHQPSRVTCQIFDEKIAIILEDSITKPEQILVKTNQEDLAEQVRSEIDEALQPELRALIEEVVGVTVIDLLSDAKLTTGRTATIVILAEKPQVRSSS